MKDKLHPGTLQLLNYSMGLPIDEMLENHINGCPACQQMVSKLQEDNESFDSLPQPERKLEEYLMRAHEGRQGRHRPVLRWASVGMAVVLVAVVALFVFNRSGGIRFKGSLSVQVYVSRDSKVIEAREDFLYRKGDRIRLGISSPVEASAAVYALESGRFVVIPQLSSVPVTPGEETILPGNLALECEGKSETIRISLDTGAGKHDLVKDKTIVLECEQP